MLLIHIQQGGVFITELNLKSVSRCISHCGCAGQISLHQLAICVIRAGHMSDTKVEMWGRLRGLLNTVKFCSEGIGR